MRYKWCVLRKRQSVERRNSKIMKLFALPLPVDFGDHEMADSHNFHMARHSDHSAYYPPVISPCLHQRRKEEKKERKWDEIITSNNGHGIYLMFCFVHELPFHPAREKTYFYWSAFGDAGTYRWWYKSE